MVRAVRSAVGVAQGQTMTSKSDVHEKIERKLSFAQWLIIVVIGFVVFIFISLIDVAGREFTGKSTPNVMRIFVWVYIFTFPLYQIFKSSNEESKKFLHYILSVIIGILIFEGIGLASRAVILDLFNTLTLTGILIFSIIFGIGRFVLVIWFLNWLPEKTLYVGAVTHPHCPSYRMAGVATTAGGRHKKPQRAPADAIGRPQSCYAAVSFDGDTHNTKDMNQVLANFKTEPKFYIWWGAHELFGSFMDMKLYSDYLQWEKAEKKLFVEDDD